MLNPSRFILLPILLLAAIIATSAERTTYFVPNTQGSPIAATDEQGNLLWRESYLPYGERTVRATANPGNPAYTGKPEDADSGFVYMGARLYDPKTGRFTGMDPQPFQEGNPESFGRYGYANNSPYRYTDPNGETPVEGTVSLLWDIGQVAAALFSGAPVGPALIDVGLDAAGFVSPAPGTGALLKSGYKFNKLTQGIRESRGARNAATEATQEGERFVRVAAKTRGLKMTASGGVQPGTYAFPESTFKSILTAPDGVKGMGDIPGGKPSVMSIMSPPPGTAVKRGTVPGGEFGGPGGAQEVIFPQGF